MKKWWIWIILFLLIGGVFAGTNGGVTNNSNESSGSEINTSYESDDIEGEWMLNSYGEDVGNRYPDFMDLYSDGTGVADNNSLTWEIEEEILRLYIGVAKLEYKFSFADEKLYLEELTSGLNCEYTRANDSLTPLSDLIDTVWTPEYQKTLSNGDWKDNPTFTIADIADNGAYIIIVDSNGNSYDGDGSIFNNEDIVNNGSVTFNFEDDIPFNNISIMGFNERSDQELRISARYSFNGIGDGVDYYKSN